MTVDETIAALLELGFQPAGATPRMTVRAATLEAPITCGGKGGGKLTTVGGRRRFSLGNSDLRVTVGPRTVNLYRARYGALPVLFIMDASTKELTVAELRAAVEGALAEGRSRHAP